MLPGFPFKLAVICGGVSQERGVSLNSARSLFDHLDCAEIQVSLVYVSPSKHFYRLSPAQLYSNTPSDFDFKLSSLGGPLSEEELRVHLLEHNLVYPLIHGVFGEDGELQDMLERWGVPFVGSSSSACLQMFDKDLSAQKLKRNGYFTLPRRVFEKAFPISVEEVSAFFEEHQLSEAIVKPVRGGSSIGVSLVRSPQEAQKAILHLFQEGLDQRAILEPRCVGAEFTLLILEARGGGAVPLIPTEIVLKRKDELFDYRKKYLPTDHVTYLTPPSFSEALVKAIRDVGRHLFTLFEMRDVARLDGWVLEDGTIYFSEINPVSGMEQNSFLFRQAALLGFSHRETIEWIIASACRRYQISFGNRREGDIAQVTQRAPVFVVFGNHNAERQVSLMSGTNVWLKLNNTSLYRAVPFLYDEHGSLWELPYSYALNHTVEEVHQNCVAQERLKSWEGLTFEIQETLGKEKRALPHAITHSREEFLRRAQKENAFVFLGLHGGSGEDGTWQTWLEEHQIPYNGSCAAASALCMDKIRTGTVIEQLNDPDLIALPKVRVDLKESTCWQAVWEAAASALGEGPWIVKPVAEGSSAGVVVLNSGHEFSIYCNWVREAKGTIPAGTFSLQTSPVEIPKEGVMECLIEPYIAVDQMVVDQETLREHHRSGWIELTIGVLERRGEYMALFPSISLSKGALLTVEEKFQGGTGTNLTPPPESILTAHATKKLCSLAERAAKALGIRNYARLDLFFHRTEERMIVIEANTLPALTPSTVLFHQAWCTTPPLSPADLLHHLIVSAKQRFAR